MNKESTLQNQPEQNVPSTEGAINRRVVSVGLAALGLSILNRDVHGRTMTENERGITEDDSVANVAHSSSEDEEAAFDIDSNKITPLGVSEELRDMAENHPQQYLERFRVTTVNAESPTAVAERIALLLQEAAIAGCNPNDFSDEQQIDDSKAEAASKYHIPAVAGMSGVEDVAAINPKPIENSLLFNTITDLHDIVFEKYAEAARSGSTDSLSFSVVSTGHEMSSENSYGGIYGMVVDVEATVTDGGNEPEVFEATLGVTIRIKELSNPTQAEKDAHTRIQAISLNEERTVPFHQEA